MGGHGRVKPGRGIVVVLSLDPAVGHEQKGVRPCVVVSAPEVIADQRYALMCVVPVTGTPGEGALYPRLAGCERSEEAVLRSGRPASLRRQAPGYPVPRPSLCG